MQKGRVVKVLSDRFAVYTDGAVAEVKARKRLKREILPVSGDIVLLEQAENEYVLSAIEQRKSRIVRPPIANADQIIITLAPVPEADFFTIDKMLINAHKAGLLTVICVNKTDITPKGFFENVYSQYNGVADSVVSVCAAKSDITALKELLHGKFSCFAGQSAVGKTSLINAICGLNREVGALSEKTMRGKNTTTGVELIRLYDDTFIADTPGFGALDIADVDAAELPLYYEEYVKIAGMCKYHMCTHTGEPDCAVREAVKSGELNKQRYERYLILQEELKKNNIYRKNRRKTYEKQ